MLSNSAIGFVLIAAIVLLVVIVTAVLLSLRKKRSAAPAVPLCGRCGYQIAPNPNGLTVCPECGGDFLDVGILGPNMKLGRGGYGPVILACAWIVIVGVGMVPLYSEIVRICTVPVTTSTTTQNATAPAPLSAIDTQTVREQRADRPAPEASKTTLTLTPAGGGRKPAAGFIIAVDHLPKEGAVICEAPPESGLKGLAWNDKAAEKAITAATGEKATPEAIAALMAEVESGKTTSNNIGSGGVMFSSMTSFGGTTVMGGTTARRTGRITSMGSSGSSRSMNSSSSTVPTVFLGPLRGGQWVLALTCLIGLTLALGGAGLIAALTGGFSRQKKR